MRKFEAVPLVWMDEWLDQFDFRDANATLVASWPGAVKHDAPMLSGIAALRAVVAPLNPDARNAPPPGDDNTLDIQTPTYGYLFANWLEAQFLEAGVRARFGGVSMSLCECSSSNNTWCEETRAWNRHET
jgi:hypothetical protein